MNPEGKRVLTKIIEVALAGAVVGLALLTPACSTLEQKIAGKMRIFPGTNLKPINYFALPYKESIVINETNKIEKYGWTIWPYRASKNDLKKYNLKDKDPAEYFPYFQEMIEKGDLFNDRKN